MFGRIKIDYDERADALVVPRMALLDDEGDPAVFAVKGGKAARVPVKLGYIDGNWAEIRSGLAEGTQVVVTGKTALRDGTEVQVLGEPGAKPAVAATTATKQN
jgi:membrane fusion protein (multidrug efflux system)